MAKGVSRKASSLLNYMIYAVGGVLALGGGYYIWTRFKQMGACLPNVLTCNAVDLAGGINHGPLVGVVIGVTGYGSQTTGSDGIVKFCNIPSGTGVTVTGTKAGYTTFSAPITVNMAAQNQAVLMIN